MDMRQSPASSWRCVLLLAGVIITWLFQTVNTGPKCSAMGGPPALTEEQVKAFTWFNTLGFPDAKGRPFVRVATGYWSQTGSSPENSYVHGLLLEEKGEDFTVLTLDLTTRSFHKTPKNAPEHERVGYEKLDLSKWTADYLKWLHEAAAKKDDFMRQATRAFGRRQLAERAEIFVIAWVCWRNGLDKEAGQIYNQAAGVPAETRGRDRPAEQSFRQGLAVDIGHGQMWQAVLDFGHPSVSRPQLLERFERIVRNYPQSEHVTRARETITLLKQMIKEDEEHAKKRAAGKPFEQLSKREQIEELIFQLRDQNGKQDSQPGSCDIFDDFDPETRGRVDKDTPAHQLVKMGYDAIPQLIEVLEDQRFTRSVGYHRDFYFSHYVLRVGDCAEQIITRIAGRSFYQRYSTSGAMVKDSEAASVKKRVQDWYEELKKNGAQRMLVEATEKGDWQSVAQAKMLLKRYPDAASASILAGAKAAKEDWARTELVKIAAQIKGDGPLPFLLSEVKDGPFLGSRLAAAEALHKRGRSEGVTAMIVEWNHPRPVPPTDRIGDHSEFERDMLARFLAHCGKPDAVAALAKDFRRRPVSQRFFVLLCLGFSDSKAVQVAIVDLLVSELDDDEQQIGTIAGLGGKNFSDPRMCDIAGHFLNQLDPQKYPFDASASVAQRDKGIVLLKNAWRKEHGLAALPVPSRVIPAVADDKLLPLVDKFLNSPSAERSKWRAQIEQLGVGALPGVTRYLEKIGNKEDPRRVALEQLAQRLACIVGDVTIADDSIKPEGDLARQLEAMKGKPFDPSLFYELVDSATKKLPKGVHAIQLSANRAEDGTGFLVKVALLDEKRAAPLRTPGARASNEPPSYNFSDRVAVGKKSLHSINMNVGGWLNFDRAPLQQALTEASRAPVNQPIEVYIQVVGERAK
jgi:hypothetical protein